MQADPDLKHRFPDHHMLRIIHAPSGLEFVAAIPRKQRDLEHEHAAALFDGAKVTIGGEA